MGSGPQKKKEKRFTNAQKGYQKFSKVLRAPYDREHLVEIILEHRGNGNFSKNKNPQQGANPQTSQSNGDPPVKSSARGRPLEEGFNLLSGAVLGKTANSTEKIEGRISHKGMPLKRQGNWKRKEESTQGGKKYLRRDDTTSLTLRAGQGRKDLRCAFDRELSNVSDREAAKSKRPIKALD